MPDVAPPAPSVPEPMDAVHVTPIPATTFGLPASVLLHLPEFTYLDTQAWSLDVGIPRAQLGEVIAALTAAQVDGGDAS